MAAELYRENTMNVATVGDNAVVAAVTHKSITIGQPRPTGINVFIRNPYPAAYNHVVRNMNSILEQTNVTKKKYSMRGGHFLLYRLMIIFACLLCFSFGIASIYAKPCAVVSFVLSVLYIALSIYNIVIFILNSPLIYPRFTRKVSRGIIPGGYINEFYTVPVNATVLTGVIAAIIDPTVIATAVHEENIELDEIQFMLYDDRYERNSWLPKEIIIHLIIFIILFILAIAFVSTKSS
ncbi:unnamed protein product [Rotaria magnacalcarata]|uniref:Uncharacterized protein n=1 Tax=Rotaria magnacalcarata TaxID=392030 RepID=A0A816TZ97_9BILA|nr:unnamed protein product [Rotaria magnacalcarata]